MMILRSSPPSPFGRKVKIVAHHLGLMDKIQVVATDTADPKDAIRDQNPLGKIPTLILDDGQVLFDSRVIVEYFNHIGGGKLIPAEAKARFTTLTLQALGDGIMDAAILQMYEQRFRDEAHREPKWVAYQAEKVERALVSLEAEPPKGELDMGHIAVACALGYLDLRFGGVWRKSHPKLVVWLDAFAAKVPSFDATKFVPAA